MKELRRFMSVVMIMVMMLTIVAFGIEQKSGDSAADTDLVIDITSLSGTPSFIDWTQDGIEMQVIARKDAKGDVRLAFNTCQACAGSPYAWFEDLGNGNLQCQNCGWTFPLDVVGTDKANGCNPVTISNFTIDGDTAIISGNVLSENAPRFVNWKSFLRK